MLQFGDYYCFGINYFFHRSSDIRRRFFDRRRKILSRFVKFAQYRTESLRGCQKGILSVPTKTWRFYPEKNCFLFGSWAKKRFSPFREIIFGRLVKTAFNLTRKFFFEKIVFFKSFRFLTKPFRLFDRKFSVGLSTCILRVQKNIIMIFCRKKTYHFWTLSETLSSLWRVLSGKLHKNEF